MKTNSPPHGVHRSTRVTTRGPLLEVYLTLDPSDIRLQKHDQRLFSFILNCYYYRIVYTFYRWMFARLFWSTGKRESTFKTESIFVDRKRVLIMCCSLAWQNNKWTRSDCDVVSLSLSLSRSPGRYQTKGQRSKKEESKMAPPRGGFNTTKKKTKKHTDIL